MKPIQPKWKYSEAEKAQLLQELEDWPDTRTSFCRDKGIKADTIIRWQRDKQLASKQQRPAKESTPITFVEYKNQDPSSSISITLLNGIQIRVGAGEDLVTLQRICKVLGEV